MQYAMMLYGVMALLLVVFFSVYFFVTVIWQNTGSNRRAASFFAEEIHAYYEAAETFGTEGTGETLTDRIRALYEFVNGREIRAHFVLLDAEGELLSSNLTESNRAAFLDSTFLYRAVSRMNARRDAAIGLVCDAPLAGGQECAYSVCRAVRDENGDAAGFLFFNLRRKEIAAYARTLPDDLVMTDRYGSAIFSTLYFPEDPEEKLPPGRYGLNIAADGFYNVNEISNYARTYTIEPQEIHIYTLTPLTDIRSLIRFALIFFLLSLAVTGLLLVRTTRFYTDINVRQVQTSMELRQLEAQFNPHFVFNVMETVRYQIAEDSDRAQEMLLAFSGLMRYSINRGQAEVRLETDIDYLNDYLMLQKIRYNNLLEYSFEIPDELLDCTLPKLLLQPVIENSIRHGFVAGRALHIRICAAREGGDVVFSVEDDGRGIDGESLQRIRESFARDVDEQCLDHIGLYNIQKLLSMMYGEKYGILIESGPGEGTCVRVRVPYGAGEEDDV